MVEQFKDKDSIKLKEKINQWERENLGSVHVNNVSFLSHGGMIYGFAWYDKIEHN